MAVTTKQLRADLAGARGDLGAMESDNAGRERRGRQAAHDAARLGMKLEQIRDLEERLRARGVDPQDG
jgi:hypothetical protein